MRQDEDNTIERRFARAPAAPSEAGSYRIRVVEGTNAGEELLVRESMPSRIFVGSSKACELVLVDRTVSRRHFAVSVAAGALVLSDAGSTNGTFVNGVRVREAMLFGGETIRCGDCALAVEALSEPRSDSLPPTEGFGRVLGASVAMRKLYPLLGRLAQSDVPVLIEGETGTGKEVLAESLHEKSRRADGPYAVLDCTAIPHNLVEAVLFGHEKGAFTGAVSARPGVFEQAHGGTLLIDEIGDLDPSLQPKLLRAIERSSVQRIGSSKWIHVDVRLICATRRDLEQEIARGRFRDDLFYRIAVARVELPPLRARQGDVRLLARAFWERLGATAEPPEELLRELESYSWPGNVRELYNVVAQRLALGDLAPASTSTRRPSMTPTSYRITRGVPSEAPPSSGHEGGGDLLEDLLARDMPYMKTREVLVAEFTRRYLERLLKRHGGNVSRAAQEAGVARRHFYTLLEKIGSGEQSS
jgi:DNA-binding NtrC family response regulator